MILVRCEECVRPPLQIAVLITVGFIGCWSPYGMVSLWSVLQESSSISPEVSLLPCMFAKSSTVYNPFIYYIFSHNFKAEVRQLWRRCQGTDIPDGARVSSIYVTNNNAKTREVTQTLQEMESSAVILA